MLISLQCAVPERAAGPHSLEGRALGGSYLQAEPAEVRAEFSGFIQRSQPLETFKDRACPTFLDNLHQSLTVSW